ncbi:MAG: hypothetical protein JXB32_13710 [Deltaproteobacteria bacterium]|nr:hypothetical protein [Deltaproteobacteria bacterium]
MTRISPILALAALAAAVGCTTPTAGKSSPDTAGGTAGGIDPRIEKLWKESRVSAAVGETHNIKPNETPLVKGTVDLKKPELRKCFEQPVLERGCRSGGIPRSFDAMLMITEDGSVRELRIVPGKQDLPRACDDAVRCVADLFTGLQVQGLERFVGARQAYMTVTLLTPDEAELEPAADGGPAGP